MRKAYFLFAFFLLCISKCFSLENRSFPKEASSKRVLVTGGAGFLGSHLCEYLLGQGYEVLCLDNLCTGSMDNLESFLHHPNFRFILHDVCEPIVLEEPVDAIYNLACPASPPQYQKDPVKTLKTSILGALHVLEMGRKWDAKVLQASTSEVYGDPLEHPQKETYWGHVNPIGVRACYDEGKRSAETLFFDYHRLYGLKIKVARIFNTYGPRMSAEDGRIISNFIVQAINNAPLTVYGTGAQSRSFCYVQDLVEALVAFMETEDAVTGPLNLGNPAEYTVLEIAQKIIALTKSSSPIAFNPLPQDDPKMRRPDITLARKNLHWQPTTELEEGLMHTISYFKGKKY